MRQILRASNEVDVEFAGPIAQMADVLFVWSTAASQRRFARVTEILDVHSVRAHLLDGVYTGPWPEVGDTVQARPLSPKVKFCTLFPPRMPWITRWGLGARLLPFSMWGVVGDRHVQHSFGDAFFLRIEAGPLALASVHNATVASAQVLGVVGLEWDWGSFGLGGGYASLNNGLATSMRPGSAVPAARLQLGNFGMLWLEFGISVFILDQHADFANVDVTLGFLSVRLHGVAGNSGMMNRNARAFRLGFFLTIMWGCNANANHPYAGQPAVRAENPPPAISGGSLTVSPNGLYAVAADADRDVIHVVDLSTSSVTHVALSDGDEPGRVVFDGAGRANVVLRGAAAILSFDPTQANAAVRREVCAEPRGLAYRVATDTLIVACATGYIAVLRASGAASFHKIGTDLRDVLVLGDTVVLTTFRSPSVLVLNDDFEITQTLSLGTTELRDANLRSDARLQYQAQVAWRAVALDSDRLLVAHERGRIGPGFDGITVPSVGRWRARSPASKFKAPCAISTVVHSALSVVNIRNDAITAGPALASMGLTVDVAVNHDNQTWSAVSAAELTGFHATGAQLSTGSTDTIGASDCVPPAADAINGQAIAVAFASAGPLAGTRIVQTREPSALHVGGRMILLDARSVRDSGHDLFHADPGAGLACASCHAEGGDDGRVWEFAGLGLRRTQPLRGGIKAPFHWRGEMADLGALVRDGFGSQASAVRADQIDAFSHWLSTLPALRANSEANASVARGRAIFERSDTACVTCHSTDGSQAPTVMADVGTDGMLRTPSLQGLVFRAPYMHNGCAATLEQRFADDTCGGTQHGQTRQLNAEENADLRAYLLSL